MYSKPSSAKYVLLHGTEVWVLRIKDTRLFRNDINENVDKKGHMERGAT